MTQELNRERRVLLAAGGMLVAGAALPMTARAEWTKNKWTALEKANVKVVDDSLAAMQAKNIDGFIGFLAADAEVRLPASRPVPPAKPEALRKQLGQFVMTGGVEFKILETIAQGPMVINSRIDRITMKKGVEDHHYMGVFFLKDGKIKEWSDYELSPPRPVKPGQPL